MISAAKLTQLVVELGTAMETIDDQQETIQELRAALTEANHRASKWEKLVEKRAGECASLQLQVVDQQSSIKRLHESLSHTQEKAAIFEKQLNDQKREADILATKAENIYRKSVSRSTSPSVRPHDISDGSVMPFALSQRASANVSLSHQQGGGGGGPSNNPSGPLYQNNNNTYHSNNAAAQQQQAAGANGSPDPRRQYQQQQPPNFYVNPNQLYRYEETTGFNRGGGRGTYEEDSRSTRHQQMPNKQPNPQNNEGGDNVRLQVAELQKLYSSRQLRAPSTVASVSE